MFSNDYPSRKSMSMVRSWAAVPAAPSKSTVKTRMSPQDEDVALAEFGVFVGGCPVGDGEDNGRLAVANGGGGEDLVGVSGVADCEGGVAVVAGHGRDTVDAAVDGHRESYVKVGRESAWDVNGAAEVSSDHGNFS